jgi:hypothetical protein
VVMGPQEMVPVAAVVPVIAVVPVAVVVPVAAVVQVLYPWGHLSGHLVSLQGFGEVDGEMKWWA